MALGWGKKAEEEVEEGGFTAVGLLRCVTAGMRWFIRVLPSGSAANSDSFSGFDGESYVFENR